MTHLILRASVNLKATAEVQLLNLEDLFIISVLIERRRSGYADISWQESCRCIDGCCIPFGGEVAVVFTGSTLLEHLIERSRRPCFVALRFVLLWQVKMLAELSVPGLDSRRFDQESNRRVPAWRVSTLILFFPPCRCIMHAYREMLYLYCMVSLGHEKD